MSGVAVVTGGALGIGAAIAEELGRQGFFVVTVDPGVAVDGRPQSGSEELTTAQRIVDAGGRSRASNISVTDGDAVRSLFADLVEEFGALDAVVNVAGISRPTTFATGVEDDWQAVLSVHLDGYLNVLRAALPLMVAAGHGRILGVTSGSGWRPADAGAYSCAKRAVAALTWRIGQETPEGVTVNALSPIAATRMVLGALSRQASPGPTPGAAGSTGGVSLALSAVPPPEHLGPIGSYLSSEDFSSWSRGQIMFSNGAEVAWVVPPRLLEVARTADVKSLSSLLDALGPTVLAPAEAAQATNGGGNPRVAGAFDEAATDAPSDPAARRCAIVTDVRDWGDAIASALAARGVACVGVGAWQGEVSGPDQVARGFDNTAEQLARLAGDAGPIDAVVVALAGGASTSAATGWQRVLDEHVGITDQIRNDASWARAVSDLAAATERHVRLVTVVDATNSAGRSRAQAAAQLSRAAHQATSERVDAFAISVESAQPDALASTAEIVTFLVTSNDAGALSGAEFVADSDWFGLRTHPIPAGSVTFGGPDVPGWLDRALRDVVTGGAHR
jgi:NAD(P)-dependent dehydrogenase (short-subunit alcohol dehydrogenase family)